MQVAVVPATTPGDLPPVLAPEYKESTMYS